VIARAAVAVAAAFVPASAHAGPPRPAVAITASPAHVAIERGGHSTIRVANSGAAPVVIDVARAGFALGAHGQPRALVQGGAWLAIRQRRIALGPGATTTLALTAKLPARATPGDHSALVLLTTRPAPGAAVGVRMRIGVSVVVRVPGRIEHRLVLRSLRVRRRHDQRVIEVVLANRGNVIEQLPRGRVAVVLVAGRRVVARLRAAPRELLPRTTAVVALPYRGMFRGPLTARVAIAGRGGARHARRLRVRM